MVESPDVNSFVGCFSMDRHTTATEYEEIIRFCKAYGFYYAVKAEDTNSISEMGWDEKFDSLIGKVHIHFCIVRPFLHEAPVFKDPRFGCCKVSHMKAKCLRECPSLAAALASSINARTYALLFQKMTSDQAIAYMGKESQLKTFNLPDDLAVLRPYISLKKDREYNAEDNAHVKAYLDAGYPEPATMESVWDYLTTRWYEKNDCKRVKMEQFKFKLVRTSTMPLTARSPNSQSL